MKQLTDYDACIAICDSARLRPRPNKVEQVSCRAMFGSVVDNQVREIRNLRR
jgi:hypothetical protein